MELDVSRLCRVCLGAGAGIGGDTITSSSYQVQEQSMASLFSGDFGVMPSLMMMMCTKVKVNIGDGLPHSICNNCIYRLGVAYHFKQQCEHSDVRLRQYLGMPIDSFANTRNAETDTDGLITDSNAITKKIFATEKKVVHGKKRRNYKSKPKEMQSKRGPKPKEKIPQICCRCNKTFKCAAQLVMHIRTHTGERPFSCTYCPRRFAQKHNLSTHMRIHTGEKPFQCEVCSKRFSALGNFQSHQKIHIGIRDQICPICNKGFLSGGDLSRHMITHTGIKNHHCEICNKGFYRNRDLANHKYKVHNANKPIDPMEKSNRGAISTNGLETDAGSAAPAVASAGRLSQFRDDSLIAETIVNLNYL